MNESRASQFPRPVLTKEQLWPPCSRCGSDGFSADFGPGFPEGSFFCIDCNFGWYDEVFPNKPETAARLKAALEQARPEIEALRQDPTCFSYRGLGRVMDNTPS